MIQNLTPLSGILAGLSDLPDEFAESSTETPRLVQMAVLVFSTGKSRLSR